MKARYWMGEIGPLDDFKQPIEDEFIDGKTIHGPWGIMTPKSWRKHGVGRLGMGSGQRYVKTDDGKWMKMEG